MKISLRILLINFLIVVLILGSSFLVFYNVVYDVLTSSQTRSLRQSANNFIYVYRTLQSETEEDFASVYNQKFEKYLNESNFHLKNIDFILQLDEVGLISKHLTKNNIVVPEKEFTLKDFLSINPYLMIIEFSSPEGKKYIYGRAINNDLLGEISRRINSDIALIWNGYPADFSNLATNEKYLYVLTQAVADLKNKNNFELYIQGTESENVLATIYKPANLTGQDDLYFLIFSTFAEVGELRATLQGIFIIIVVVGIALALIFTLVFTAKLRKQITELSNATELTYKGKFDYKIDVKSKDEIGKLGTAFNKMLEELKKKEVAKNEYAEFITLINQNPSLKEISDVALKKILDTGDFIIGGLYTVDDNINLISSYGLNAEYTSGSVIQEFFKKVLETKKTLELYDSEELPVISTGLINIKIKYLLFLPIVYNNRSIALLELGSLAKPREEVKDYLEKIKDQLAIGITNARALLQLELLVGELKKLNSDYEKQNIQIKEQNEKLILLHNELKVQAEELEKQKQKAVELTDAKSKFLANMSHELRTPMNSILGLTELMLEKADLEPRNKERLEVILNSGKRLMTLINDILDLSKIEAGKVDILKENVKLEEIITEISGPISMLAKEKNIDFNIERKIDTQTVIITDRGKIVQVLINLLGNAIKYTDEGKVTLRVIPVDEMLNFEIIDTGIGISDEEAKVIFEEFRQSNSSKSRRRGGTGLGLAICKRISEILEGELKVKSQLNHGSTFTFSIPFVSASKDYLGQDPKSAEKLSIIEVGKKSLILVDFESWLITSVQKNLSVEYNIIAIEGNPIDFKIFTKIQPAAIILNNNLTGNDSWGLFNQLKMNVQTQNIPLILFSSNDKNDKAYFLDVEEFLQKPFSSEEVSQALLRLEDRYNINIHNVIIIDDDQIESEKFNQLINSKEIFVEPISNSEEALKKIENSKPDLVIVDLTMPGINGVSINYMLKSNSETSNIPVILTFENELSEMWKSKLTDTLLSITQNSNLNVVKVFELISNWINNNTSMDYSLSTAEKITAKLEVNKNNFVEIQSTVNENSELDIMIVDDDTNTLFTLAEIVQAANCNPILTHNGKECLELLETKIPDLIFLDIIMPEMDGFKTIDQIKKNKRWSEIPVFAVTAKAMKEDTEIILKHGFADYIPKPVNPAFVEYKIQSIITQLKTT